LLEERSTAPTADGPSVFPDQSEGKSPTQPPASVPAAFDWSADSNRWRKLARRVGGRNWLPVATTAGLIFVVWIGFRLHSGRRHDGVGLSPPPPRVRATVAGGADTDPRNVANRIPELLTDPLVQGDPALSQALQALPPPPGTITTRDVSTLEAALAHWWTNDAGLTTNLASLPLASQFEKRVRKELFNDPFPGLANALQNLAETCRARRLTSSNLARVTEEWNEFGRQISSTPDLALWREYSVSSNLFQLLVERDFEEQFQQALSGNGDAATIDQRTGLFSATKSEILARLSARYYAPPDKLKILAKYKDDLQSAKDLRESARVALTTEIRALEEIAHGRFGGSYSSWKNKLRENYAPTVRAQIVELPLVEQNLKDLLAALNQRPGDGDAWQAAQNGAQTLKKDLASLRQRVESLSQAAGAGLVSQESLSEARGKFSADLRSIQNSISTLAAQIKLQSNQTAHASETGRSQ
jgi:ElaB/YqjD/DUF883 family membrane-anchored ribosome-binding protein